MKRLLMIFLFSALSLLMIHSASVNVDELTILADTHYNRVSQSVENNTYFKFITSFDGGYKFAARAAFEANVSELQQSYNDSSSDFYNKIFMLFRSAEVSARNLANEHLDLTFWTGTYKYLGSGNKYRGYLYYPETTDRDYAGFYRLKGTGVTTSLSFWENRFRSEFHFYQNTNFVSADSPGAFYYFTFDAQAGLYFEDILVEDEYFNLFVEVFTGITFPRSTFQQYKVGMSFGVGNQYLDFMVTAGLPKIDASVTELTFHHLYLSSDFHFKLFITDHTFSFLTRPLWYNEQKYDENDVDFDINYKFNVIVPDFPITGGFVVNFQYELSDPNDPWNLFVSPFMNITFSGVVWSFAAHYDFSRIYIGNLMGGDQKSYLEGLKIVVGASSRF